MAVFGRDWNTPILTFHETSVQCQYHAFYDREIPRHQPSSGLDSLAFELENVDAGFHGHVNRHLAPMADRPALQRSPDQISRSPRTETVVRVLSATNRGTGTTALDLYRAPGTPGSALRFGDLRRRRVNPG